MRSAPAPELVRPAYHWAPKYHRTLGPEVADLGRMAGFAPDLEQALILDSMFALDRQGRRVAFESAVVCSRQNLKTGCFKIAALGWLYLLELRLVVWSAHEFSTSAEAFRDILQLIESVPDLDREVLKVSGTHGQEAIELTGDRRLKFKARTATGGRGLTGDSVVLDEAFALSAAHMGALLPTLSAVPDPQVVYGSSAGLATSAVLRGVRDRGRAGGDPRLAYDEWCDPDQDGCGDEDCDHTLDRPGCALDDEERWRLSNPLMGRRISAEYIRAERRALASVPAEFARERLGWWDEPGAADQAFSVADWEALTGDSVVLDEETGDLVPPGPDGTLVIGADVGPNHASSSISATDGEVLELLQRRAGSSWLVPRLVELCAEHDVSYVVVDPAGPIGALMPALEESGIPLYVLDGKGATRACGAIVSAVHDQSFRHRGEFEYAQAVAGARRRENGDGHKWSRKDSTVDITPLVSGTNALWVATTEAEYDPLSNIF